MTKYDKNQTVLFKKRRCQCVGGGITEAVGKVVGIIKAPNGTWYQIDQPTGIVTIKEEDIIRVYE